ncbi:reverse transcriptase [Gossypium australe]|uniref:Reverse transcriptase n=1 Tax=Gossypium australe TaxID=47621 RepID=A0A5B6WET8_9ROSI|nr:reverse transcriptase [Gossypium australe]
MFNKALLPKQGWKLITNPTGLLAQVFTPPLTDEAFEAPETFWKKVLGGGSGMWLAYPGEKMIKGQNINWRYTVVVDFIDEDLRCWNFNTLNKLFSEEQVKQIVPIPLVNSSQPNVLAGRGDKSRIYTARSSYRWRLTE